MAIHRTRNLFYVESKGLSLIAKSTNGANASERRSHLIIFNTVHEGSCCVDPRTSTGLEISAVDSNPALVTDFLYVGLISALAVSKGN